MTELHYAVVGAGLAGSATAWELARRGNRVTVLERTTPANQYGSSHGSARIFRYAYPDPFYAGLVQQARGVWDELESLSESVLIAETGAVDFGDLRDPEALGRVLTDAGVQHEVLSAEAARERWPQFAFDTPVLWHRSAGVIDVQTAVTAMLGLAQRDGALVEQSWEVSQIESGGAGFLLHSTDGQALAVDRVVVSAGAWLPVLLGRLPLPQGFLAQLPTFEVRQEQVFHFPFRADSAEDWPTFIHKSTQIQTYGLPGGRDAGGRGQKVAQYNGGRAMASAAEADWTVDPANRELVTRYVERYLPGLVATPYAEATCLFTNTPSQDFLIDGVDGLTVVSPCSGHGAKFAPLIGRIAADVATGIRRTPQQWSAAHHAAYVAAQPG